MWWAVVLVVVAAVLLGVSVFRSNTDGGRAVDLPEVDDEADPRPQLVSTRVVGRRQGDRQFELDAGAIADDDDWVRIDEIENGLLYRDGEVFVTFDAAGGRWHRPSNNLVLVGDVVLVYDGRVHMRTDELEWRAAEELVISPGPVSMVIDGDVVQAARMEADLDEERVRLVGDVHIVRPSGESVEMAEVVYWLAEDRLEGYGRGRLVFGGEPANAEPDAEEPGV